METHAHANLSAPHPQNLTAMMVIDGSLRVLSADAAAKAMLDASDGLRLSLGRLCTGREALNGQIRDSIDRGLGAAEIALGDREGQDLMLSVFPMSGFADGAAPQAVAVLRARGTKTDTISLAAKACGLTASETEVLRLVFKGLSTVEAASVLGLAKTTVRTHLQHIFAKTDTSRQSELVHFVATFAG